MPAAVIMLLCVMMSVSLCPVFAAGPSDSPDSTSRAIQQAAGTQGNTATVTLGKILTCTRGNDFPIISDFVYSLEAVRAWDNANANTALSGVSIEAANMPMPAQVSTAHQNVNVTGTKATVVVGNFMDTDATNHSTGDGVDTANRRTRTTPVRITFEKAGYYLYKVKEVGSIPGNAPAGTAAAKNVPGVDYDANEYFMVFYVCNKVDAQGNTTDGVYVHSITSYTNESGSETYKPNLTEIQNVTDNGGTAAGANTGQANANGTVTHNLGKVGVSDPTTPNQLEAYRMWNAYVTRDVVLKKNVTGNLGDLTKVFEFTITLTGLGSGYTYVTNRAAAETGDMGTVELTSVSPGTKNSGTSFTASESGQATLQVRMKDDDVFVINDLPLTAQYTIREAASDHVAKYGITSSNTSTGSEVAVFASAKGTNSTTSNQALTTATETVDRFDNTVTVLFTNNRDLATITGVPGMDYMVWIIAALLLAAAAVMIRRRQKHYDAEMFDAFGKSDQGIE